MSDEVEVCPDCDIADCQHIRAEKNESARPAGSHALRECPFCGGTDLVLDASTGCEIKGDIYQSSWIYCKSCGCEGPTIEINDGPEPVTTDAVAEAWNKRI